jgi:DNA-binding MarR family transcriptional regulator
MLDWQQRYGSATSARLAAEFDYDRGATSYHPRQLERFGFVEEDTGRSAGRRRFWSAVPQGRAAPPRRHRRRDRRGRRADRPPPACAGFGATR